MLSVRLCLEVPAEVVPIASAWQRRGVIVFLDPTLGEALPALFLPGIRRSLSAPELGSCDHRPASRKQRLAFEILSFAPRHVVLFFSSGGGGGCSRRANQHSLKLTGFLPLMFAVYPSLISLTLSSCSRQTHTHTSIHK